MGLSQGRRRRLTRSALLLVLALVAGALWLRDRIEPAPSAAPGPPASAARPPPAAADPARAAADAERLETRSWRLAV